MEPEPEERGEEIEEKEKTCKRCKERFKTSSNSSSSCRFHPSFFVCRRHDDQKSTSSIGASLKGSSRNRYYELGPDDPPYAAKFFDCCGAEEPDAPGCKTAFHVSYDDEQ